MEDYKAKWIDRHNRKTQKELDKWEEGVTKMLNRTKTDEERKKLRESYFDLYPDE